MVFCIEQFKPVVHEVPAQRQILAADNLFDNERIRTMLEGQRYEFLQTLIKTKYEAINDFGDTHGIGSSEMPSLKSVMGSGSQGDKSKGSDNMIAAAGIVRLNMAVPEGVSSYVPGSGDTSLT